MTYGRFALAALLSFLALCAATIGVVLFLSGRLVGGDGAWTSWSLDLKEEAAAQIDGPKLIIISGSSGNLGYSAEQLSEALGVDVVNMASHAGLAVPYFAYLATRNAAPGDVVVLPLEYEAYSRDKLTSLTAVVDFERGLGLFGFLEPRERVEYLRAFPVGELLSVAGQFLAGEQFDIPDSGYWRFGVNAYGDLDLPGPSRTDALKALGSAREAEDERLFLARPAARYLTALRNELNSRGVQLILTQPPLHEFSTLSRGAISNLASQLEEQGLEYHYLFNDNRVPADMMLDSRYHTGASGRRVATARLALVLCDIVDFDAMAAPGETCTPAAMEEQRAWSDSIGNMATFARERALNEIAYRPAGSSPLRRSGNFRNITFDAVAPVRCHSMLYFRVRPEQPETRVTVSVNGETRGSHLFTAGTSSGALRPWSGALYLPHGRNELARVRFTADRWNSERNNVSLTFSQLFRKTDCPSAPGVR
ncbi:hypothetical protein [Maricaulis sp.]|uniref:hypothetical protein n=1 Tax=Maricaulis sp. TaxID=1486257 RepID=UPI003A8F796B